MDRRRAAGALLALAACIACTTAAPAASNQTALDLYEGDASEGCYYNFQHYGEGDRIMTNEPCLNCTCHNRMLMCYLRVCPFTKPIGSDCTVEKRADQCCPIVTCPDVPVDLLTSTSTSSPAEYGTTGVGRLDKYGCSINGKYFAEGSKVPPSPDKPCEHCYCIRNMTTCVMQECTLHVDGCTPIYHKEVCCPVRYSCDHPEDEVPLLDDMTTTVRPTPGFLLTTTQVPSVTQIPQDCVHDDEIFPDGTLIKTEKACEHCYCMKGDIVCVVQECGTPMENEGKNCTSIPPREGQCCPDTYICEGDNELPPEDITTLMPPRRTVEGSGYRIESEDQFTEQPYEPEGSGEEQAEKIDDRTTPLIEDFTTLSVERKEKEDYPTTEKTMHDKEITTETPEIYATEPDKSENTVPSDLFEHETTASVPEIVEDKTTPGFESDSTTESYTPSRDKIDVTTEVDVPKLTTEPTSRKDDDEYTVSEQVTTQKSESLTTVSEEHMVTEQPTEQTSRTPDKEIDSTTILAPIENDEKQGSECNGESCTKKETNELGNKFGTDCKDESCLLPGVPTSSETSVPTTDSIINQEETLATTMPTLEDNTKSDQDTEVSTTPFSEYVPTTTSQIDLPETTSVNPIENEIEKENIPIPQGIIPGEGNCLVNGVTYNNYSVVPASNKCQSNCKCVSSIVKCDPVICADPPQDMMNCRLIDDDESCCPNYMCDTLKETTPLISHNQVSGTETPVTEPAIKCEGDQCIKDSEAPTNVSPQCTSEKCTVENVEKDNTDCGPSGCDSQIPTSESHDGPEPQPEVCLDGKCISTGAGCVGDNCQTQTQETEACNNEGGCKKVPVEKCDGANCDATTPPLKEGEICSNQENCAQTPAETKCEGDDCKDNKQDCVGGHCETISPSEETKPQECIDKDNCQVPSESDKNQGTECNDESCTKKVSDELGNKFGTDCKDESCLPSAIPTSSEASISTTDSIMTEEETLAPVITDTGVTTPAPIESITNELQEDDKLATKLSEQTTPVIDYVTDEGQKDIEKEITTQGQTGITETPESITESEHIDTAKPELITEASIIDVEKQESTKPPALETTDQTPVESYDGTTTNPEAEQATIADREQSTDIVGTTEVSLSDEEHKKPEIDTSITPVMELTTIADKQVHSDSSEKPEIEQVELETEQPEKETIKPTDKTDYNPDESTTVQDAEVVAETTEIPDIQTPTMEQTEQPIISDSPGSTVPDRLETETSAPNIITTAKQETSTSNVSEPEIEDTTPTASKTEIPEDTPEKIEQTEVTTKQSEEPSTVPIMEEEVPTILPAKESDMNPAFTEADVQPFTTLIPDVISSEKPGVTETITAETSTDASLSEVTIPESLGDQEKQTQLPEITKPSEVSDDTTTLPELTTQITTVHKDISELPGTERPTDVPLESTEASQDTNAPSDQEKETEAPSTVTVSQESVTEPSVVESEQQETEIPDNSSTEIPAPQEPETKSPLETQTEEIITPVEEKLTEAPELATQNPISETTTQSDVRDVDQAKSPETSTIVTDDQQTETPDVVIKPSEPTLLEEEKKDSEVTTEDAHVTESSVQITPEPTVSEKDAENTVTVTPNVLDQDEKSTDTIVDITDATEPPLPERRTSVPEVVTQSPASDSQSGSSESTSETPVETTQSSKSTEEETEDQVTSTQQPQLPESEQGTEISQGMTVIDEEDKTTKTSEVYEVTEKVDSTQVPERVVPQDQEIEAAITTEKPESEVQTEISTGVTEPVSSSQDELENVTTEAPVESQEVEGTTIKPDDNAPLTDATPVTDLVEELTTTTKTPSSVTEPSQESSTETRLIPEDSDDTQKQEEFTTTIPESQEVITEIPKESTTVLSLANEQETVTESLITTTENIPPKKDETETEPPALSIPVEVATEVSDTEKYDRTSTAAPLTTEELETQSTVLPTDNEIEVDTEKPVTPTLPPQHEADSQKENTSEAPVSSDIPEIDITKSPEEPFTTTTPEYPQNEIEQQPTTMPTPIVTDGSSVVNEETVASKIPDATETPKVPSEDVSEVTEHTTLTKEPSLTEKQDVTTSTPEIVELETIAPTIDTKEESTNEQPVPEEEKPSVTSAPDQDITIAETDSKPTDKPEEPITTPTVIPEEEEEEEPKLTTVQVPTEVPISSEPSSALPEAEEPSSASELPVTEDISKETETSETTPYFVELEEHTHKMDQEPMTTLADEITIPSTEKGIIESVTTEKPIEYSTETGDLDSKFGIPVSTVPEEPESTPSKEEPKPAITTMEPVETEQPTTEITVNAVEPHKIVTTPSAELATTEATSVKPDSVDKYTPLEEKPTVSQSTAKPTSSQPTEEPEEESGQFPPTGSSGYGQESDYAEEDQAIGPGTCRYGGKVYVSAQQIPRDDPCDFCFCFRSDIICLQQSCPPPIHGCHEEPIQGFCCPRYECPVSMATTLNVTTTTTTTTTTLPPHFLAHAYNGAAQRRGCQIKGQTYKVGEVVRASSGPCLHCTCGGDGQMKCDPKVCTPEPMLRQMIAAAVSAKRRR